MRTCTASGSSIPAVAGSPRPCRASHQRSAMKLPSTHCRALPGWRPTLHGWHRGRRSTRAPSTRKSSGTSRTGFPPAGANRSRAARPCASLAGRRFLEADAYSWSGRSAPSRPARACWRLSRSRRTGRPGGRDWPGSARTVARARKPDGSHRRRPRPKWVTGPKVRRAQRIVARAALEVLGWTPQLFLRAAPFATLCLNLVTNRHARARSQSLDPSHHNE